ncbi:MAG: aldo/keto reductase [Chloroflexi bacterium]|nr:aldo/keto reductase [Chloroflexota bacterium]
MERRALGTSGIDVPVIGMGTWKTFDVRDPRQAAHRATVVDAALASGTNLFDSSPMYGAAEQVLGAALDGRRERALVATKVWTPDDAEAERQIQRALSYYQGRVDVYQVHNLVALPKRLERLEQLRDDQRVGSVGITHYEHAAFPKLMETMRSERVTSIQVPYNVRDRLVEDQLLPLAGERQIGVLIMRPLGVGELARQRPTPEQLRPFKDFGVTTWSQVLLKWLLSDPRVTSVIPATSNPEHARENAVAGDPPWFGPSERAAVVRLANQL